MSLWLYLVYTILYIRLLKKCWTNIVHKILITRINCWQNICRWVYFIFPAIKNNTIQFKTQNKTNYKKYRYFSDKPVFGKQISRIITGKWKMPVNHKTPPNTTGPSLLNLQTKFSWKIFTKKHIQILFMPISFQP